MVSRIYLCGWCDRWLSGKGEFDYPGDGLNLYCSKECFKKFLERRVWVYGTK